MRGQVAFYNSTKNFAIVVAEITGEDHLVPGCELSECVDYGDWVSFDSEPNSEFSSKFNWTAKNVRKIDCPEEYLLYGYVVAFFPEKGFGFIKQEHGDIFFHSSDLLIVDGVRPAPCAGCRVSFCLAKRFNKTLAVQVWIEEWPADPMQDFEKYFEEASELPVEAPEPVAVSQSSVLAPKTRNLSLLEIIRQRREGKK